MDSLSKSCVKETRLQHTVVRFLLAIIRYITVPAYVTTCSSRIRETPSGERVLAKQQPELGIIVFKSSKQIPDILCCDTQASTLSKDRRSSVLQV